MKANSHTNYIRRISVPAVHQSDIELILTKVVQSTDTADDASSRVLGYLID